ncbi:hypothetical protein [Mesorhizobium sp. BR-1-1-10]|uniref:hypothetical protein n=1 Tax=Mesorhizobium sp. BR-1-1-10 TaxID=2876660 RepID=UPI001CD17388|nr:hypothetical protein [Mesorhizobium sp. BR-1-1-10]MBZ9975582.1 hypothetical protein [Mesorhizobium sp. BR-1-1-10]
MVSAPDTFALWIRVTGLLAAVLFLVSVGHGAVGRALAAELGAAAGGWLSLVLTFVGWIWMLLKPGR